MSNLHEPFVIQCEALTKVFDEGQETIQILDQVDFTLQPKEKVAIIGASGSGKSTLLHILGGLDQPSEGCISIMGHPIAQYSAYQLSQMRNRYIGFVYQFHYLLPEFTLLENIAMPLLIRGEKTAYAKKYAREVLEQLSLSHKAHCSPNEVSGGEKQRVAIGRAIATQPAVILADEPTGNLDHQMAHQVIDLLCSIFQTSVIIVTHDQSIAMRMDKIMMLEQGRLIPTSKPHQTQEKESI